MTKQELLQTGYFLDNSYLSEYIQLTNNDDIADKLFLQEHHIIPKSYFKHFKLDIDNTTNNLVNLTFKNHVKAHYLLMNCTVGFLRKNNSYALRLMINGEKKRAWYALTENDFNELESIYEATLLSVDKTKFINYYTLHTCKETAYYFNICSSLVTKLAIKYDCLKLVKSHKKHFIINKDDLYNYYLLQNHTLTETAQYFNVDKSTIVRTLKKYNMHQTKNSYRHEKRSDYNHELPDRQLFETYYQKHNLKETSLYFNISYIFCKNLVKKWELSKLKNYNHSDIYRYYKIYGAKKTLEKFGVSKTQLYRIIKKEDSLNGNL